MAATLGLIPLQHVHGQPHPGEERRVVIPSDEWRLVGDLQIPAAAAPVPAVLLLNQAAGERSAYVELADELVERGIASLRVDLRGHGESTNLDRFVPGQRQRDPLIWSADADVIAAHAYLLSVAGIDSTRIGVVAASYSGEEAAEAGRIDGYAAAYVLLSPGSLSGESIQALDGSGVPWLIVTSRDDPYLREIIGIVEAEVRSAELVLLPGTSHATNLLSDHREMPERVSVWLARHLR